MSDVILKVENLEKSFGGLRILTDVNFDVKAGQKLALIGPNGAGKSTLLNTIGGQGPATGGKITFDGNDITHLRISASISVSAAPSRSTTCSGAPRS